MVQGADITKDAEFSVGGWAVDSGGLPEVKIGANVEFRVFTDYRWRFWLLDMGLQKKKGCGNCGNWWFGNGTEKDDKWKCGTMISLMVQNCDRSSVLKAVIEIFWYSSGETLVKICRAYTFLHHES